MLECGSLKVQHPPRCHHRVQVPAAEPPKPVVAKVREPVADEQLMKLKATLKAAQDAQRIYSKFTQEQVCARSL